MRKIRIQVGDDRILELSVPQAKKLCETLMQALKNEILVVPGKTHAHIQDIPIATKNGPVPQPGRRE